jgi:hypothetical protein
MLKRRLPIGSVHLSRGLESPNKLDGKLPELASLSLNLALERGSEACLGILKCVADSWMLMVVRRVGEKVGYETCSMHTLKM